MGKLGEFNSIEEAACFSFSMRATSNDLKNVKVYGNVSYISTDQELPYDNEKEELSSVEIFVASVMESMLLTIIREAKINKVALDEIECKAEVEVLNPLRTLKVIGIEQAPKINSIKIRIYYYIDDFTKEEGKIFIDEALLKDPIFKGIKKGFDVDIKYLFQL